MSVTVSRFWFSKDCDVINLPNLFQVIQEVKQFFLTGMMKIRKVTKMIFDLKNLNESYTYSSSLGLTESAARLFRIFFLEINQDFSSGVIEDPSIPTRRSS